MSDAAFREALDAYVALREQWAVERYRRNDHSLEAQMAAVARARLLALYDQRQGEERVRTVMYGEAEVVAVGTPLIGLKPTGDYRVLRELNPGDRVRVTKVEEGKT